MAALTLARVELIGQLDDAVRDVLPPPVRVVEQEVLHVLRTERVGAAAAEEDGPLRLGAEREGWEDEGLVRIDVVVVDLV